MVHQPGIRSIGRVKDMIIVLMLLVLCVLVETLVIKELLEQKRQIVLQLKLLEEAYIWRMDNREEV